MKSRVIDIVIAESISGPELLKKLTRPAKQLFLYMSLAHRINGQRLFDSDEMLDWPGFSDDQDLMDCLYELESRSFGRVRKDDAAVFFDASIPLMDSVKLNPDQ